MNVRRHVPDDMPKDIQADQINRPERCRFGPAHCRPCERVHFLDGKVKFLHQSHDVEYGKCPDAIGNEIRSVFRTNHTFPEANVAEPGDCADQFRVAFRRWDNLQQSHVARRIKEMRTKPAAAKILGKPLRDLCDR